MRDLISLSAFPKSGVTYLSFLMFYSLFSDDCAIAEIERRYIIDIHENPNGAFARPKGPHLIKSHFPYHPNSPAVRQTKQAIYLIRNPIDVMMSAWDFGHLIKGGARDTASPAFRAYARNWVETGGAAFAPFGTWVQNVGSWSAQSEIPVHFVKYEDLVDDAGPQLKAILDFLGIAVSEERQRTAIERSSMKSMAALEAKEVENQADGIFFRKVLTRGYSEGHRFINKGYRKSYETVLTPEERSIADKTFAAELARFYR